MKWFLCVVVFHYLVMSIVIGAIINKGKDLTVDPYAAIYGDENERILHEGIKKKKISCTGSHRTRKIEWYNPEGKLVESDSSISLVYVTELPSSRPGLTLIFSSTRASDSGIWECRSGDEVRKVPLCIMDPAEGKADDMLVDEGRSVTLSCKFRGNPEPRIQWYRKDQLIVDAEDGDKYFTSTKYNRHDYEGQLTIKSVTAEDQDDYTCKAVQEHPEYLELEHCIYTVTVNMSLNVNREYLDQKAEAVLRNNADWTGWTKAPLFSDAPRYLDEEYDGNVIDFNIFAQDGENITLVCNPSAFPDPEFRWFTGDMDTEYSSKNFNVTYNGSESTLPLVASSASYGRKFICKAANEYGELITNFKVIKKQKPLKLTASSEFVAQERTLYFNVSWDNNIIFPIDGFEIEYFEKISIGEPKEWQWKMAKVFEYEYPNFDASEQLVPLRNLKINTEYWVRMRAYNDLGSADWSSHILASTAYEYDTSGFPGVLIGAIVTAAIIVFAGGCILIIKRI